MLRFIIIIFFTSPFFSFSHEIYGKVLYKAHIPDYPEELKENNKGSKIFESIFKEVKNIEMELKFNSGHSYFSDVKKMKLDENDYKNMIYDQALVIANVKGEYFIDLNTKEVFQKKNVLGSEYLVKNDISEYEWKLLNETKVINGYVCHKATKNREFISSKGEKVKELVTAWYAPGISVSIGPIEYAGLPGLILELKEGMTTIVCTDLKITKEVIEVPEPENDLEIISEKEYNVKIANDPILENFKQSR